MMRKNIIKILILVLIIGLGVQSCKVGPNYERTELYDNEAYVYDSIRKDTIVNVRWWEQFQDSVLVELIEVGLQENLDVKIATARIEEARAYHGFTKADYWPSFGYNLSAGARNDIQIPGLSGQQFNSFGMNATVAWELDFWGKFRRATESAKADMLASEASKRSVMISLIAEIAESYFLMLDYEKRLKVSQETYEARKKSVELMQAKFDYGYIPQIDLNQAQIQLAIAEASVPKYERLLIASQNQISVLLGKTPSNIERGDSLDVQSTPPPIPVGIPSHLIERRPDILQAEYFVMSQNAQIGVAVAQRFPSIGLTGAGGLGSNDVNNLLSNPIAWSLSASIIGPIFEFGKNKRRVEVQKKKAEQAIYSYKKTVLNAFRGVENALVSVNTLKIEYEARSRQVEAAKNALYLSEQRYDKGVTSYLEVLEQQRAEFESQLVESQAHQEYLTSYVRLYKELGGGWISPEEEEESKQSE